MEGWWEGRGVTKVEVRREGLEQGGGMTGRTRTRWRRDEKEEVQEEEEEEEEKKKRRATMLCRRRRRRKGKLVTMFGGEEEEGKGEAVEEKRNDCREGIRDVDVSEEEISEMSLGYKHFQLLN